VTELEPVSGNLPAVPEHRQTEDPYWVYLNSLESAESKRTMKGTLDRIAKILTGDEDATGAGQPWSQLTRARVIELRDMLTERGYSPSHVNKHLIAVRRVLYEAWLAGDMSAEEYQKASAVKSVKGSRVIAGRDIGKDELAAILKVCDEQDGPAWVRNSALIVVLYATGIRRFEAATALVENYDHAARTLRIIGKRNKERKVPLMRDVIAPLDRWIAMLGTRRGPIFRPVDKHGHIGSGAMSPRAIGYVVDRTRKMTGLTPLSTHDFRRTFIGDFIDAGGDLAQAQQIAGHTSATTTVQYDRRPERAKLAAVDRMSIPLPEHDDPEDLTKETTDD
jgi:site-specific recombinase XerD